MTKYKQIAAKCSMLNRSHRHLSLQYAKFANAQTGADQTAGIIIYNE